MSDSWIKEIFGSAIGHEIADFAKEEFKKLFAHVTPTDRKYMGYKLTGVMPLEDENLYNRADAEFGTDSPNLARMHSARIGKLQPHMQDYYRLTMCGYREENAARKDDDRRRIDDMKGVMRRHALMSDAEWQDKIRIMNLNQAKADTLAEQLKKAGNVPVDAAKKIAANYKTNVDTLRGVNTILTNFVKNQWK